MNKTARYTDIAFLLLLGWFIGVSIVNHFNYDYVISVNTYVGILGWLSIILLKFINETKFKYGVLILLVLTSFNIISFSTEAISLGSGHSTFWFNNFYFFIPGINPLLVLILIVYFIINKKVTMPLYRKLLKPSDKEIMEEYNKNFKFYYDKFSKCGLDEFIKINASIKDYPVEAQEAISKVTVEKLQR